MLPNAWREIKGVVLYDHGGIDGGQSDGISSGLKDITVKLYMVERNYRMGVSSNDNGTAVLKERLFAKTRTNEKGEFRFLVRDGGYSLSLETDTLPAGKGVINPNILIDKASAGKYDFIVRDVASIDESFRKSFTIGDTVYVNPVLRDRQGNILASKVEYSYDGNEGGMDMNRFKPVHREFKGKRVNIQISAGQVSKNIPLNFRIPDLTPDERIRLAYRSGIIDERTKVLYYLYTMFDKYRLAYEYRSEYEAPIKSGTTMMEEITDYIGREDADPKVRELAKRYLAASVPQLDRVYTSPGGYFKIHYTLSGSNAVSVTDLRDDAVPDYIRLIGETFEEVKGFTCGTRGFREPVTEGGGFDVYVYNLNGKYGVTTSLNFYKDKVSKKTIASCYISMDNTYSSAKGFNKSRDDCMKVTAAHEFFHAVQYAYNVHADTWWKEASATWNEDEIYSSVNDYMQYLDKYFSSPQKSLDENSYSGVLFVKHLSENWGGYNVIKRIWEAQGSTFDNSLNAIDRAVGGRYARADIGTVFGNFTAWNYNPAQYYQEGSLWKENISVQNTYSAYPVLSQTGNLNHLAANYQVFKPIETEAGKLLKVTIDGADKMKWSFKLQKRRISDDKCEITDIVVNDNGGRAEILVSDFNKKYKEICLIPANLDKELDNAGYSYSAAVQ